MKTSWSKILLSATATSVLSTGLLNSLAVKAQAKNQTQLQAPSQTEVQNSRDESDEAALPVVCLGMGYAEQEPERDNSAYLGLGKVQSSQVNLPQPSLFAARRSESKILTGQASWGTLQRLDKGKTTSLQLLLTQNRDFAQTTTTDRSQEDDDGLFVPDFNAGRVCDILSLAVLTPALLVTNAGDSSSGGSIPPGTDSPDPTNPTNPTTNPIDQPPNSNPSSTPPSEGLLNQSATVLTSAQPPKKPDPTNPTPIPTPALLPGIIGFTLATLRKHRSTHPTLPK